MSRAAPFTRTGRQAFVAALEAGLDESGAAKAAGTTLRQARAARARHPDFARAWDAARHTSGRAPGHNSHPDPGRETPAREQGLDAALDAAVDALEACALELAARGTPKPVFYGGERIGETRDYPVNLLMFLLKALKPERYGERGAAERNEAADLGMRMQRVLERRRIRDTDGSRDGDA